MSRYVNIPPSTNTACVGEPREGAELPDADITINPNGDKCSKYVLPAGTLTANRVLTIANAGGDNTKVCTIVVQDISAFTYTIQNSTPSTLFIKVASPGQAMTYQLLFSTNNIWNAYEHWWTD